MKKVWLVMLFMCALLIVPLFIYAQLEEEEANQCSSLPLPPATDEIQDGNTMQSIAPIKPEILTKKYGTELCGDTVNFFCHTVVITVITDQVETEVGVKLQDKEVLESWEILWGNTLEREIVMKINRRNIKLKKGDELAVPRKMKDKTFMDYSPFPYFTDTLGEKLIIWDPNLLAYAAYNEAGKLVRWGPGVGGKDYCADVGRSCRTRVGEFRIIRKEGPKYRSSRYPKGCTGSNCASMPYAMFFQENYAFHAGNLPGANASHGCVRLFYSDAEWLSKNFIQVRTRVTIKPYP